MKRKWPSILALMLLALAALILVLATAFGSADIVIGDEIERIVITSTAFANLGAIPDRYTGKSEDVSPDLTLSEVSADAKSIAIIMDDLDIPVLPSYTHWAIWNIPPTTAISEAIPSGETVESLGGAVQGMGYGKHQYRGPNPPFGSHRYRFHVFVLDELLPLNATAGKKEMLDTMQGHILQYGAITGWYPRAK